jgi:hypothetical protein
MAKLRAEGRDPAHGGEVAKRRANRAKTTPGIKKDNPTNRKLCRRRIGFSASARDLFRSAGQIIRAAMIPQAMKLSSTLTMKMSSRRITEPLLC